MQVFSLRPKHATVMVAHPSTFMLKKPVTAMNREDVLQSIKYAILNYPGFTLADDDIDLISKAADGKVMSSPVTIAIKIKTPAQAKNYTMLMRMIDQNEQALDLNATVSYPNKYKDYALIKIQKNMDRLAELFGVDLAETSAVDKTAVEEKIKDVLDEHNVFSRFSWDGNEFVIPVGEENFKNKKLVADLEAQSGDGYTLRVCATNEESSTVKLSLDNKTPSGKVMHPSDLRFNPKLIGNPYHSSDTRHQPFNMKWYRQNKDNK